MLWGLPLFTLLRFVNHLATVKAFETANDSAVNAQPDKTWLWSWAWGSESTVSIVDRTPVISYLSRPAAFGPEIADPILGYIIPLSSFTAPCPQNETISSTLPPNPGCPDLCQAGPNAPSEPFIALVQRGQCEFVRKVREAQRLGAKAVVVGGDDPAVSGYPDTLVNMYSPEDSSDIKIAATFIKFSDYMQLYTLIANSNTTHSGLQTLSVLITAEYSAWEWYSPIITFIIILLLPSILTFLTLLIHRVRAARAARRERAPEDIVKRLPWRIYTGHGWEKPQGGGAIGDPPVVRSSEVDLEEGLPSEETSSHKPLESHDSDAPLQQQQQQQQQPAEHPWFEAQLECAICLSDFVKGDKVRVLPCHHIFHVSEIDEWLIHRKKLCPICKADVTQPHRPPYISSSSSSPNSNHDSTVNSPPHTPDANERTPLLPHDR